MLFGKIKDDDHLRDLMYDKIEGRMTCDEVHNKAKVFAVGHGVYDGEYQVTHTTDASDGVRYSVRISGHVGRWLWKRRVTARITRHYE